MVRLKIETIKKITWFLAVLFLLLAFPLQVYTKSPLPSLIPYLLVLGSYALISLWNLNKLKIKYNLHPYSKIFYLVCTYVVFIVCHIGFGLIFAGLSSEEAFSEAVIYLLPVLFFFYFRKAADTPEIRFVIYGIFVGGVICALFFVYDSYLKLALGRISDYAQLSFDYSLSRSKQSLEEANMSRVRVGFRSFGLLESHSVSGTWIVLGLFAALNFVSLESRKIRFAFIVVFGLFLLISLNFSSIIAYFIIIALFEFKLISLIRGRIPRNILANLFAIILSMVIVLIAAIFLAGEEMTKSIYELFAYQRNFLFGLSGPEQSQSTILSNKLYLISDNFYADPMQFLIGNLSGNGRGGDVGFFETMFTFGIPYYLIIMYGIFSIINKSLKRVRRNENKIVKEKWEVFGTGLIRFSTYIFVLVLIMDFHYSVWQSKSILPIIFFCIAVYERFVFSSNKKSY
jgi:hypothetical protein